MEAIAIYDALSKPPEWALKKITGGRLNGKTDIKPQWRYRAMVEQFGLCGLGWKFTVDKQWTEPGDHGEVLAFVNISLYVKQGGEWSDAIPGTGGSMLVEQESKGLHNSDEAYKMATTDALSTAMKFLGMAAAIYAGQWDGSRYTDDPPDTSPSSTPNSGANIATGEAMSFKAFTNLVESVVPQPERVDWKRKANGGRDEVLNASLAAEIRARYAPKGATA